MKQQQHLVLCSQSWKTLLTIYFKVSFTNVSEPYYT